MMAQLLTVPAQLLTMLFLALRNIDNASLLQRLCQICVRLMTMPLVWRVHVGVQN